MKAPPTTSPKKQIPSNFTVPKVIRYRLPVFCTFLLCGHAPLFAAPVITEISVSDTEITLLFEDPEGISNQFSLQRSTGLTETDWQNFNTATFTPLGANKHRVTVPKRVADKEFYRIIGSFLGTGVDPDGDGLPTVFENSFTSDPDSVNYSSSTLSDTDGDGFDDGVEFAYGTKPNDPNSKPVLVSKPIVNFSEGDSSATEGTSPHQIQIVFDKNYTGSVNYEVNSVSNTTAGLDYTLSGGGSPTTGSVSVSGTSALIPITLLDNSDINGQRVIIVDLRLAGESYFIGGATTHIVLLNDNDSFWTGTLIPDSGEVSSRSFRLKVAHDGGVTTALFGAGAGNDGLPVPDLAPGDGPEIGDTSTSTTVIPEGQWPGTGVIATAAQFHIDSPVMAFSAGAGSLFAGETFSRQLVLNAQTALNTPTDPHLIGETRIVGEYTETLTGGGNPAPFPGIFILVRDIPTPLPVLSELVPVTP